MKIKFKNIFGIVVLIICIVLIFMTVFSMMKNFHYRYVAKQDSLNYSHDDYVYKEVEIILNKYLGYIQNKEYDKIKKCSIFYASKPSSEYDEISTKLKLSNKYELVIENIYVLEDNIFRCVFYTSIDGIKSDKCSIVLKINDKERHFNVLDIVI